MKKIFMLILVFASLNAYALDNNDTGASGDVLRLGLPAAAYGLTFLANDSTGRMQFYKSFGTNIAASLALKSTIKKERPDHSGDDSFPSAHASMSFQAAAFMQMRYGWEVAAPAYVLAAYTGWTRLQVNEHDETDVAAGALLGVASAYLFTTEYKGYIFAPVSDGQMIGLGVSKSW